MQHTSDSPLPPLVVFADDWGRHPSSCQHLIRRLIGVCPILWVNTVGTRQVRADSFTFRRGWQKIRTWMRGLQPVEDQMWVVDVPMLPGLGSSRTRYINRQLVTRRLTGLLRRLKLRNPIVLTTLPYAYWLVEGMSRQGLIYYCTDDYRFWPSADRETLQQADQDISASADLVLAASQALVHSHRHARHCEYFPHGVDFDHFTSCSKYTKDHADVAELPHPRLGFFGLIYEKLDFGLLTEVANGFTDGSLVMIGPVDYCPPEFRALPNVHFLGKRPYQNLPEVLSSLDVLMLPYKADDDMIRQSGPLKMRECLASGKPTVSVDVPENRLFEPHVRIARDGAEFVTQIKSALAEDTTKEAENSRQATVANDGWDARAAFLREQLASLAQAKVN